MAIQHVTVIGSGVMGSGIAAHLANAGLQVLLLDIVPKDGADRDALAKSAVQKQLSAKPPGFTLPAHAKRVTCGNLDDHLEQARASDWIIEVVVEKREVKQALYRRIDAVRKPGAIVSSNTSTLPLHVLVEGMPESFAQDFLITHFFNPPRFMRLLELVAGPLTRPEAVRLITDCADMRLGKGVVVCKDTPGFIANRIGVFWLMSGLLHALRLGVRVELADAVMGKPLGMPKTGIFGLFDLIGIDLMPLIAKEMLANLPEHDAFRALYEEPELITRMIKEGYTGRKGKGGFTRLNDAKKKETLDLQSGEYRAPDPADLKGASSIADLLARDDLAGRYGRAVLADTFAYAASSLPEIADDLTAIDDTMRWGYNWKFGPFELMDMLGSDATIALLQERGVQVPPFLERARGKRFYSDAGNARHFLTLAGDAAPVTRPPGVWLLADKKRGATPVLKNSAARLWDIGDGIACLELTSKMNALDGESLAIIQQSLAWVEKNGRGLVIGGDGEHFSAGANLGFLLYAANMAAWSTISDIIKEGQRMTSALKYAPFPVVAAAHGLALGGGCEILLHADAVQAHIESYSGLVETGVGLVPGWGGCKEMLLRHVGAGTANPMPGIIKAFEAIAMAKVSGSADEARSMQLFLPPSRVSMNRARVLPDAKALCLQLAESYQAPAPLSLTLPGPTAKTALLLALDAYVAQGKASAHDKVVGTGLAHILSGGDTDITETISEAALLALEHDVFMELIRNPATLARVEHMLATGKPLRN